MRHFNIMGSFGTGKGKGNPLQYSCLENPMDGGAWWATVHGVTKSLIWLSDFTLELAAALETIDKCTNAQGKDDIKKIWSRSHQFSQEKAMAPHSSTLAWKIPWTEEPGRLQSMRSLRGRHNWATSLSCTGERNDNPLQCSCLENPRDRGAWWAAVYGVAQSRTRLKWLSSSSTSFLWTGRKTWVLGTSGNYGESQYSVTKRQLFSWVVPNLHSHPPLLRASVSVVSLHIWTYGQGNG